MWQAKWAGLTTVSRLKPGFLLLGVILLPITGGLIGMTLAT